MQTSMWMDSGDVLWVSTLYLVRDATKANGPVACVAMCFGWIVVANVAPNRVGVALVAWW